jgi:hypothetical protein
MSPTRVVEEPTFLEHMCSLNINTQGTYDRLSGIICTIGEFIFSFYVQIDF